MSLSVGIVGLPNVGKSTLFNALTKKQAAAENFPFCTIEPNVGVVTVPDARLEKIAAISKPKKIIPTAIEFIDIAGLVKGAHQGEGLGNQFLAHIRECDAICQVVRQFKNDNIVHVEGRIDPTSDREVINLELVMADLNTVEKRLVKAEKEAKSGSKETVKLKELLLKIKKHLEIGRPVRTMNLSADDFLVLRELNLLTLKPVIYVLNISESEFKTDLSKGWDGEVIKLNLKQEEEIARLDEEEQIEFIKALGFGQSGLDKLIQASYHLLGLITFFTTGSDETRAWTVRIGARAPQAAGRIHTDFERGFIRAEVIGWQDFIAAGGEAAAREKGLIRTEGKDYIIQDGDICHFLFSS